MGQVLSSYKEKKSIEDLKFHGYTWGLIRVYFEDPRGKKKISTRTPPPILAPDYTTITKGIPEKPRQAFTSFPMDYLVRFAQTHESFRRPELQACATLAGVDLEILSYNEYV
jgi:hypothetical protein